MGEPWESPGLLVVVVRLQWLLSCLEPAEEVQVHYAAGSPLVHSDDVIVGEHVRGVELKLQRAEEEGEEEGEEQEDGEGEGEEEGEGEG